MLFVHTLTLSAPVPRSTETTCRGLGGQFFVRVEGSIVNTFGGGVNIWNSTGFIASDAKNARLRMKSDAQVRELSSGPGFDTESQSLFVDNSTARSIAPDGSCTSAPATRFAFPASACVGSISRFMPHGAHDTWPSGIDSWMGYNMLNGVNVSVWGWTQSDPGRPANAMHRVYLEAAADPGAGRPILEEHGHQLAESYPTRALVRFSTFETILGSDILFSAPGAAGMFAPPMACRFELPVWDQKAGTP
jgi:hypothetical protein